MRLALAFITVLAACDVGEVGSAGGSDAGSGSGSGNEASFMTTMLPIAMAGGCTAATLNGVTCHGGGQPPTFANFASVNMPRYLAKPGMTMSILITKDVATPGMHNQTTYWDAGQKAMVAAWIDSLP